MFINYTVEHGPSANSVWSILRDKTGRIWVGTHEGVCRFEGGKFAAFPLPRVAVENPESRLSPQVVFAMAEDGDGKIWFGTDGEGVHHCDGLSFVSYTQRAGLAGSMVRAICVDCSRRVWIGTNGDGVSCLDGEKMRNFGAQDGLNNDRVYEIFEDRDQVLWFGCSGGLFRLEGETFVNVTRNGPWPANAAQRN